MFSRDELTGKNIMERYEILKTKFKILLQKIFIGLPEVNYDKIERSDISYHLFHGDKAIFYSSEYIDVMKELLNYPQITSHFDQLIGSMGCLTNLSGPTMVQTFVTWNIWEKNSFEEDDFNEKFNEFIKFFESENLTIVNECRLFNFESDIAEIKFEDNLWITRGLGKNEQYNHQLGYENFSRSNFVIVQKMDSPKILKSPAPTDVVTLEDEANYENYNKHSNSVLENCERIIKAIRIQKNSACYLDHARKEYYSGFFGQFSSFVGSSFLANTVIGTKFQINQNEIAELVSINLALKGVDELGILSSNRLSYIVERKNIADKVLDSFIGIEALYLQDGSAELTFRLSLRVAKMLESEAGKQEEMFSFVKDMYGKRSKLVHGEHVVVAPAELERLENILRISVKKYLLNKDTFNKKNLNKIFF